MGSKATKGSEGVAVFVGVGEGLGVSVFVGVEVFVGVGVEVSVCVGCKLVEVGVVMCVGSWDGVGV